MEVKVPSGESAAKTLADIDLPVGDGPRPHRPRFIDPQVVEAHFAPLLKDCPSPEQRWAGKADATPFPGL
jgi:hypothetical protein